MLWNSSIESFFLTSQHQVKKPSQWNSDRSYSYSFSYQLDIHFVASNENLLDLSTNTQDSQGKIYVVATNIWQLHIPILTHNSMPLSFFLWLDRAMWKTSKSIRRFDSVYIDFCGRGRPVMNLDFVSV